MGRRSGTSTSNGRSRRRSKCCVAPGGDIFRAVEQDPELAMSTRSIWRQSSYQPAIRLVYLEIAKSFEWDA